MELLQLRYFVESAKTENFSRTAEKYNVPTTSVSAAVKRLESELGVKLFERSANRIVLNSAGKKLYHTFSDTLLNLDLAVNELTDKNADKREIFLLVRAMRRIITDCIIDYAKSHLNVSFKYDFDSSVRAYNEYNIILDTKRNDYFGYECLELHRENIILKTYAGNPLAERSIKMADLKDQNFILMKENSTSHMFLLRNAGRAGFTPRIIAACNDVECYEKMIASGLGIGIGLIYEKEHTSKLKRLDVTDFDESFLLYIYYRKEDYYGNVKDLIEFLKNQLKTPVKP